MVILPPSGESSVRELVVPPLCGNHVMAAAGLLLVVVQVNFTVSFTFASRVPVMVTLVGATETSHVTVVLFQYREAMFN